MMINKLLPLLTLLILLSTTQVNAQPSGHIFPLPGSKEYEEKKFRQEMKQEMEEQRNWRFRQEMRERQERIEQEIERLRNFRRERR